MIRPGHTRPAGTVWRMRLRWHGDGEPQLGDLVYEALDEPDPPLLERGFLVVGVEEVARPGRWNVLLERLDWPDFRARLIADPAHPVWPFVRDRR